jgi:threonine synthase
VAAAAARAVRFEVPLACAHGNLAGATAAAAAAVGLPAYVFIPADLEREKVDALAYGATVVAGTYDDVNRLCLETPTRPAGVRHQPAAVLRGGSKTLAYEIAEGLAGGRPTSWWPR